MALSSNNVVDKSTVHVLKRPLGGGLAQKRSRPSLSELAVRDDDFDIIKQVFAIKKLIGAAWLRTTDADQISTYFLDKTKLHERQMVCKVDFTAEPETAKAPSGYVS